MAVTRQGMSTTYDALEDTQSLQRPSSTEKHDEWMTRLEKAQAQQGERLDRIEGQLAQIAQLLAQLVAAQARTASPLTEPREATEEQGRPALVEEEVEFMMRPGKEPMQELAVVEFAQRAQEAPIKVDAKTELPVYDGEINGEKVEEVNPTLSDRAWTKDKRPTLEARVADTGRSTEALVTSKRPARIDDKAQGVEKAQQQSGEGRMARRKRARGNRGRGSKARREARRHAQAREQRVGGVQEREQHADSVQAQVQGRGSSGQAQGRVSSAPTQGSTSRRRRARGCRGHGSQARRQARLDVQASAAACRQSMGAACGSA